MRIRSPFLFAPDDPGAATPVVEPPAAVEPPPAAVAGAGPWAKDLEEFFTDPTERTRVDQFMREKYQPHVTKLEQDSAPARALYDDLIADPVQTIADLTGEIYGDNGVPNEALASKVLELLQQGLAPEAAVAAAVTDPVVPPAAEPAVHPKVQAIIDREEAAEANASFEAALEAKRTATGSTFTRDEISPYVVSAEGDVDAAYDMLVAQQTALEAAFKAKHGIVDAPAAVTPPAPAALGSAAAPAGGVAPPVAESFTSFDDALDSFASELKAQREAPTVIT